MTIGLTASGVWVDAYGTGTDDDTALWRQAISDAASLGCHRIYMSRPSRVIRLSIDAPIEIVGVHGVSSLTICDSWDENDYVLSVTTDYFSLRGVTIIGPHYKGIWGASNFVPKSAIICETGTSAETSVVQKGIHLHSVTTIGFVDAIRIIAADRLLISNVESRYAYGHGLVIGQSQPASHIRVDGYRAVACGAYGLTLAQLSPVSLNNSDHHDLEFVNVTLINCGKLSAITGYDGGAKFGADLTSNALQRMRADITAIGCQSGGVECKDTGTPLPASVPNMMADIDLTVRVIQDTDAAACLWVGGEPNAGMPAGAFKRVNIRGSATYRGPLSYAEGVPYEVGDTVTVAGRTYICWGDANGDPGVSGSGGAPNGTGTGVNSYDDGALSWEYLGPTPSKVSVAGLKLNGVRLAVVDSYSVIGCGYHTLIETTGVADATIDNLTFIDPTGRNLTSGGITCAGSGTIKNIHIDSADIEVMSGAALLLGAGTDYTITAATLSGGRLRSGTDEGLRIEGSSVDLTISGDPHIASRTGKACYIASARIDVRVHTATFENETNGNDVVSAPSTVTGGIKFIGSIRALQPDDSLPALNLPSVSVQGQVCRGIKYYAPLCAGNYNEMIMSQIPYYCQRWDCTSPGPSGTAKWTAR